uniref:Uncharacterized protein n=1 Tax=Romanomermis culicivorax TaxID=13658 RepID=A0A915JX54_ROMCU
MDRQCLDSAIGNDFENLRATWGPNTGNAMGAMVPSTMLASKALRCEARSVITHHFEWSKKFTDFY